LVVAVQPAASEPDAGVASPRVLVIACGALVKEMRAVVRQLDSARIDFEFLPANLHNRPERIVDAVRAVVDAQRDQYDVISLGYADCGTGGGLDRYAEQAGLQRLPGAHCYEFFAGQDVFASLHERDYGTFYLTDFLALHFDALVIRALGIDRHPELLPMYFGNYQTLCLLTQAEDRAAQANVVEAGQRAAETLGLDFIHMHTGLLPLRQAVTGMVHTRITTTVGDPS
jgi:hypothetical protein